MRFVRLLAVLSAAVLPFGNPVFAQCGAACALPPSLFLGRSNLVTVQQRAQSDVAPYGAIYEHFMSVASGTMAHSPEPFNMANIQAIEFGWCKSAGGADDSLKDLVEKLLKDSNRARNLALAYLLSGDVNYAQKAKAFLHTWATGSTVFNAYDLNINFTNASFDGIESGFCNNSWNMMLDSMWQAYGLLNFSDTYAILTRNGYSLSATENNAIRGWLSGELVPAVNAGFHAWTRWADAHPTSAAFERYRSDNHLSWSLAGLAAAAAALDDPSLWAYVIHGGAYDDGRSGTYSNPSNFESLIGRAIDANGQVYDQQERAGEHKGLFYGNFSLWALSYVAQIAETYQGDNYWTFAGSRGGSIADALDYYARYTSGNLPPPDSEEDTDPAFFRFLYELVVGNAWVAGERQQLYLQARGADHRGNEILAQGIGPVTLITGDLAEPTQAATSALKAPTNLRLVP